MPILASLTHRLTLWSLELALSAAHRAVNAQRSATNQLLKTIRARVDGVALVLLKYIRTICETIYAFTCSTSTVTVLFVGILAAIKQCRRKALLGITLRILEQELSVAAVKGALLGQTRLLEGTKRRTGLIVLPKGGSVSLPTTTVTEITFKYKRIRLRFYWELHPVKILVCQFMVYYCVNKISSSPCAQNGTLSAIPMMKKHGRKLLKVHFHRRGTDAMSCLIPLGLGIEAQYCIPKNRTMRRNVRGIIF